MDKSAVETLIKVLLDFLVDSFLLNKLLISFSDQSFYRQTTITDRYHVPSPSVPIQFLILYSSLKVERN